MLGCAVLAVLLAAPAAGASADDRLPAVRIAGSGWVADAPTKIADALGYFAGGAATAEVRYHDSGKSALQAVLDGEADFALAATTPFVQALLDDPSPETADADDIVALATVSHSNTTHMVLAAPGRGIATPDDLAGRRVAVLANSSGEYFWSIFTDLYGIPTEAIETVDMPIKDMPDALADARVDAVVAWEPWITAMNRRFDHRAVIFTDPHMYTVNWLLLTRRGTCEAHVHTCEDVINAYERAIDLIQRDPDRARRLHAGIADVDIHTIERFEPQIIYRLSLDWGTLIGVEEQLDWYVREKGHAGTRPAPRHYLMAGPLGRIAPERLLLPGHLEQAAAGTAP